MTNLGIVVTLIAIFTIVNVAAYVMEHDDEIIFVVKRTVELQKERRNKRWVT